jgi:hypothetical protein
MSKEQLSELVKYAETQTNKSMDRIIDYGNVKARLDKFYSKIGKEYIKKLYEDFDTEYNLLISGRKTLKELIRTIHNT